MKIKVTVLLTFLLTLTVSTQLLAKASTSKITISGGDLKTPIGINDTKVLTNFNVWTGPGTSTADQQGLIIDWSHGPVREPSNSLPKYQVTFYAGAPANERIIYVVYYVLNPVAGHGYVYLPGKSDKWYGLNTFSIFRGEEGKWFPAWTVWESVANPLFPQASAQTEIATEKLVVTLRLLNTSEYSYREEHGRFANWEELLAFVRQNGYKRNAVIDLENPKPYELEITTSRDGEHYQITLKRASDMNDKSTWCKTAAFSDDAGVIFLGAALDCDASAK
jgi:hypothetical protein